MSSGPRRRRLRLVAISFLVVALIFLGLFLATRFQLTKASTSDSSDVALGPPYPSGVPATAVWIGDFDGGEFFECGKTEVPLVVHCIIYNDFTGGIRQDSTYGLHGLGPFENTFEISEFYQIINFSNGAKIITNIEISGEYVALEPLPE